MNNNQNSIFTDTNNYQSKIYPFLFTHKLITNKRFQLLFNKGNLLTDINGTNALLPIIDIYVERFNERTNNNKIVCCLGTHLFHSFIVIIESLNIQYQEIIEAIKFIINKNNIANLENWKYLLSLFFVYLKLANKKNPRAFLKIIKKLEDNKECLSLVEYGQLQIKTIPLSFDLLKDGNNSFEKVEIVTLMHIISVDQLWYI